MLVFILVETDRLARCVRKHRCVGRISPGAFFWVGAASRVQDRACGSVVFFLMLSVGGWRVCSVVGAGKRTPHRVTPTRDDRALPGGTTRGVPSFRIDRDGSIDRSRAGVSLSLTLSLRPVFRRFPRRNRRSDDGIPTAESVGVRIEIPTTESPGGEEEEEEKKKRWRSVGKSRPRWWRRRKKKTYRRRTVGSFRSNRYTISAAPRSSSPTAARTRAFRVKSGSFVIRS